MNLDRQIRYFEMQRDRNPGAKFWLPLADLHLRNGDTGRALELLDAHDVAATGTVSARWVLARAQAVSGDIATARVTLADVLAMDPAHRGGPGLLQTLDERIEAAVEDTEPTEAADLAAPDAEDDTASPPSASDPVLAPESDPTPVAESTQQASVGADPSPSVFVTRTLADIYLAQGHRDKALQILYKVLSVHPEREDVLAQIAAVESESAPSTTTPMTSAATRPTADRDDDNRQRFEDWLVRDQKAEGRG